MTLHDLEALAERVTFRDWEPHFKVYGIDFLFWWVTGEGKATSKRFVGSKWKETLVILAMKNCAEEEVNLQAKRDFRVEDK